jgi:uncharacterized protein (TIGR00299 family) protein
LIAILDPFAGISGDMTLGALVDLGGDAAWLHELPARLGFSDVSVKIEKVKRCSLAATKVDFEIPHGHSESSDGHHHGRTVARLKQIVSEAPLSGTVIEKATAAFDLVGEAEGRAHGVAPDDVHLHEVGAIDAVLDIVGAIEGFERLGVNGIYNLPVAVGTGWAKMTHGTMPVPAAATATLLEGVTVTASAPVEGEATTPTGAALIRVLSQGSPPVRWRMKQNSWGAGGRDPENYPNALRLILAEAAEEAGAVEVIATEIDDLRPEYIEPLRKAVFAQGALDCVIWPTHGKKGRLTLRLEALVTQDVAGNVIEALFANSTTAGVRRWPALRNTLARREFRVELEGGCGVSVKVWDGPGGTRLKAEYDDVLKASAELGIPALDVARLAEKQAEAQLNL